MNETAFRAALTDPALPVPAGLTDPQGRPAGRRFDVYRNNVTQSLTDALRSGLPVIRRLVGDDFFAAMAREFVRAHPPDSPLIMFYGGGLPAFLETFPPVAHLRYLPDVARLELALRQAYHAADAPALPGAALQALPAGRLMASRLRLAPAARLVRSRWPIHAIWRANTEDAPPPRAVVAENVLILRPGLDPVAHLLPPGAGAFVAALLDGRDFGTALDAGGPFDLTAVLTLLLDGGAICGLEDA